MANEEEMDDEVIEDFVEPGVPENAPIEKPKALKEVKEEKKPEVKKETSRPNEKTDLASAKAWAEDKPAGRPSMRLNVQMIAADSMSVNSAGIPRPKVELRNGREALLTRALLAEIGDYDERGPKHNLCEELQKVERLTKLLTLWENGVTI